MSAHGRAEGMDVVEEGVRSACVMRPHLGDHPPGRGGWRYRLGRTPTRRPTTRPHPDGGSRKYMVALPARANVGAREAATVAENGRLRGEGGAYR